MIHPSERQKEQTNQAFVDVLKKIAPQGRNDWEMRFTFFTPLDEPHQLIPSGVLGIFPSDNKAFTLLFYKKGHPGWNATIDTEGNTYDRFGVNLDTITSGLSALVDERDPDRPTLHLRGIPEERKQQLQGKTDAFLAVLSSFTHVGTSISYPPRQNSHRTK